MARGYPTASEDAKPFELISVPPAGSKIDLKARDEWQKARKRAYDAQAKVQKALGDMGVMEYAKIDINKLIGNDLKVADDFDKKKFVQDAIAAE